ncbi:hypothetical protein ACOME3_004742 [Neoechinorhynchus agilis]
MISRASQQMRSSLVKSIPSVAAIQSRLISSATNKFKVLVYSAKEYDIRHLQKGVERSSIKDRVELAFEKENLSAQTVHRAKAHNGICIFVNDDAKSGDVVNNLKSLGVKLVLLRCAGFNNVDVHKAVSGGIKLARVPAYSPYCVEQGFLFNAVLGGTVLSEILPRIFLI